MTTFTRSQAAEWISRETSYTIRPSTLRGWTEAALMPDHSLRGVPPEYGPAELFQGAVLALMRRDGLRVADYRDAMRCLSRMLRAGEDRSEFEKPGARMLLAHDSVTIVQPGASVPERRGPTLLLECAPLAEKARLAVYPPSRPEETQHLSP